MVESIFAIEIRSGCATRLPVITEMVVLSDDRIVPIRVAPLGIRDYSAVRSSLHKKERKTCLHIPCAISRQPRFVNPHYFSRVVEDLQRHEVQVVLEQRIPHNVFQTFEGVAIVENETIFGGEAWLSWNDTGFPLWHIGKKVHSLTEGFSSFEREVHLFYLEKS